jgi:hypothetical protein
MSIIWPFYYLNKKHPGNTTWGHPLNPWGILWSCRYSGWMPLHPVAHRVHHANPRGTPWTCGYSGWMPLWLNATLFCVKINVCSKLETEWYTYVNNVTIIKYHYYFNKKHFGDTSILGTPSKLLGLWLNATLSWDTPWIPFGPYGHPLDLWVLYHSATTLGYPDDTSWILGTTSGLVGPLTECDSIPGHTVDMLSIVGAPTGLMGTLPECHSILGHPRYYGHVWNVWYYGWVPLSAGTPWGHPLTPRDTHWVCKYSEQLSWFGGGLLLSVCSHQMIYKNCATVTV